MHVCSSWTLKSRLCPRSNQLKLLKSRDQGFNMETHDTLTWSCQNNWSTVSWQSLHLEFLIFKMVLSSSFSKWYLQMLKNVVRWQVNLTKGISTYTSLLKRKAGCLQHCFAAFFGLQIFFFRGLNFITSLF